MYDVIVVGSGAAGAWAAYGAAEQNLKTLVLDVGLLPKDEPALRGNIYDLRQADENQRDYLIGGKFQSLHNIHETYLSPKLKAPRFRYVIDEPDASLTLEKDGFDALQSFAYGGLANAWGAGTYRYNDQDLKAFPITQSELDPFYNRITDAIGICGTMDDLSGHFGSDYGLQPPLALDALGQRLLHAYQRRKKFFRKKGITIGYPRMSVLSRPLEDRAACDTENLSFWQPTIPAIYAPGMTLDKLRADRKIDYQAERIVTRFEESGDYVSIQTRGLDGSIKETFQARRVILAAGAINSAKIVLRSFDDFETRLPLLENQTSMIPFVSPLDIGQPIAQYSHGPVQLIMLYRGNLWQDYVQTSLYTFSSILGSDVMMDFPLSFHGGRLACKYIIPAMMVAQSFYADRPNENSFARLAPDGRLHVTYEAKQALGRVEKHLIASLLRTGFMSHSFLARFPAPGNGIHYAGTLPMESSGKIKYSTDAHGRLRMANKVYVADAAVYPELPAKNHTLTIMANAYRTAAGVGKDLKS